MMGCTLVKPDTDGRASVTIVNTLGYTHRIDQGTTIGTAIEAVPVVSSEGINNQGSTTDSLFARDQENDPPVLKATVENDAETRKWKLRN